MKHIAIIVSVAILLIAVVIARMVMRRSVGWHPGDARSIGRGWAVGTPGGNVADTASFSEQNRTTGRKGEQVVGGAIEKVLKVRGGVVWHGLRFRPDGAATSRADVDHGVLFGSKRVLLVDAKMWPYGTYSWTGDGRVMLNGKPFKGTDTKMANATRYWKRHLNTPVETYIVMANADSSRYFIKGSPVHDGVQLITLKDFTTLLNRIAAPATGERLGELIDAAKLSES